MDELAGQIALVTGGGRGIGQAIAQRLALAGAAVAVTARSTSQLEHTVALIEQAGGHACAIPTDFTDEAAVEQLLERTESQLGPVSLLVNNAGAFTVAPLWETSVAAWRQVIEVNLMGTFLVTRAALQRMVPRHAGRIITVSGGGDVQPSTRQWHDVSGLRPQRADALTL